MLQSNETSLKVDPFVAMDALIIKLIGEGKSSFALLRADSLIHGEAARLNARAAKTKSEAWRVIDRRIQALRKRGDIAYVKGAWGVVAKPPKEVSIPEQISAGDLAVLLNIKPSTVIKSLMCYGVMATVNKILAHEEAALLAEDLGVKVRLP